MIKMDKENFIRMIDVLIQKSLEMFRINEVHVMMEIVARDGCPFCHTREFGCGCISLDRNF